MNCPSCQTANPVGANFCSNCGTRLVVTCPRCGHAASPDARFCSNCGFALAQDAAQPAAPTSPTPSPAPTPAAAEPAASKLHQYIPAELLRKLQAAQRDSVGERRVVTVLFCDVQGSTALAEQLDPEDWTEIMNGAFEHLIAPVYRYEGTLARLMGDAILAFFGAPIAHEDDPRRAVLAGLEIVRGIQVYRERLKRERGYEFDVRVGINTGLVVVGEVGSDLRVEYTVMGDAVNLAARMEQTAQPGSVQITDHTRRLVNQLFDVESLGEIQVKGKTDLVPAYRVLGVKAGALPTRGIEGVGSALVGRDDEMAVLRGAVDGLLQGRGGIVSVMGEAGLGKSRLVAELRRSLAERGLTMTDHAAAEPDARLRWVEGRSFSYETAIPYAPFLEMFQRLLQAGGAQGYTTLKAQVAALLGDDHDASADADADEVAPFLASMLRIPVDGPDAERVRFLDPPALRSGVFQAVERVIARLAADRPLALVLEDLHWADPTSLELAEHLMPLAERGRLLLIALFRPERMEPSWRFHEAAVRNYSHRYSAVALERLDDTESRLLVANLLHVEDLPESVRALILEKSEGNPFFVEEVIRSLLDARLVVRDGEHWRATREVATLAVPDTLAGVITARLDRLDDEPKRVAQSAAVIGREFEVNVLAEVHVDGTGDLDRALTDLERRELVRERSRLPAWICTFKHGLTQETAYASILLSRRRELHRRVGETLERNAPERVNEIAHHFLEAREPVRALPYAVAAGEQAAHAYATREAIAWFRRALEALAAADNATLGRRAYEGLGRALELANDVPGAIETYHRMEEFAERHRDLAMMASALNKLGAVVAMRAWNLPEAEAHLRDAEHLLEESRDPAGLVEHATIRCATCMMLGQFEQAVGYLGRSVEVARQLGLKGELALSAGHLAQTLTFMAEFDAAMTAGRECLDVAREIGDLVHVADALTFTIPFSFLAAGDLERAHASVAEGLAVAERIGSSASIATGRWIVGEIALLRGEYDLAAASFGAAAEATRPMGDMAVIYAPQGLQGLIRVFLEVGGSSLYEQTSTEHLAPLEQMEPVAGAFAWASMGLGALESGNLARAEALFRRGLDTPTFTGRLARPSLLLGLARVLLARGDLAASACVDEARAYVREHRMAYLEPHVDMVAGLVSLTQGEAERALGALEHAVERADAMGMPPLAWQARGLLARALDRLGQAAAVEQQRASARATVAALALGLSQPEQRFAFEQRAAEALETVAAAGR